MPHINFALSVPLYFYTKNSGKDRVRPVSESREDRGVIRALVFQVVVSQEAGRDENTLAMFVPPYQYFALLDLDMYAAGT